MSVFKMRKNMNIPWNLSNLNCSDFNKSCKKVIIDFLALENRKVTLPFIIFLFVSVLPTIQAYNKKNCYQ